ncbi:hypothetical protein ACQ4PT_070765 [Festuca glaucescens]
MLPPCHRWKVMFFSLLDRDQGRIIVPLEGELHLWKNWIVLMNPKGAPIVGRRLPEEEEIQIGSEVSFPSHSVQVIAIAEPPKDFVDGHWKIQYTIDKDLDRKRKKAYDGDLHLFVSTKLLSLMNAKGEKIASRPFESGDVFIKDHKKECNAEWELVSPGKKRMQLACKGYQDPKMQTGVILHNVHMTNSIPSISFGTTRPFSPKSNYGLIASSEDTAENRGTIEMGSSGTQTLVLGNDTGGPAHVKELKEDDGLDGLTTLVDDMAYRVWNCGRCLSMRHETKYPELGWNNVPLHDLQQQNNQQQGEQMEEMQDNMVDEPVEEAVHQDSIALDPSEAHSTANDL